MPATSGLVITRALPTSPIEDKGENIWINQELIPLLKQMRARMNDQSRPPLNIRDFGAVGDWPGGTDDATNVAASTDDSAAIQACIDKAKQTGLSVLIPTGSFRCDVSLDCTGPLGINIVGTGWQSRIVGRCAGKAVFDTVGNYACTFDNFSVRGSATGVPTTAFFSARTDTGSSGIFHFNRIITDGHFSAASRVSVSSEVNTYTDCRFDNSENGGHGVAILEQNDLALTSDHAVIANPQIGGNTEHFFVNCIVQSFSTDGTGAAFLVKDAFGFKASNLFMTVGGGVGLNALCGIRLQGSITNMCLTGLGGEVNFATHGILLDAGCTLSGSHISGSIYNDIYGADTSTIQTSIISGYFAAPTNIPIDAYDLNYCTINTTTLGWRARNQQNGNMILGAAATGSISNSALTQGQLFNEVEQGGDGVTRYRLRVGDLGTASRTLTRQTSAYLLQTRMKVMRAPLSSGTLTPDPRTDGGVYFVELDQNFTVNAPANFSINQASGDSGCRLSFIFLQKAPGGFTVTFNGVYKKNWTPDTTSGRYNTISFWYIDDTNLIQDGGDVGLT